MVRSRRLIEQASHELRSGGGARFERFVLVELLAGDPGNTPARKPRPC
jgi:hypothetical protein